VEVEKEKIVYVEDDAKVKELLDKINDLESANSTNNFDFLSYG
jgi:hypothetical protein